MALKQAARADGQLVCLNKPVGIGCAQLLNILKRRCQWTKAGFAGTLDPAAGGVLLIGVNAATKQLAQLSETNKEYEVAIVFGAQTNTLDALGDITHESLVFPRDVRVIATALKTFVHAEYQQVPPAYSAIKVHGQRAYKLARTSRAVVLPARPVKLLSASILAYHPPVLTLRLCVSKGFYVRAFARDLATQLKTVATALQIVRTRCGSYALKNAISLAALVA